MPGIEQPQPAFQFGVFEVNPHTGELRKHGVKLKLQDQPVQILILLLEHPGEIVTREQIQKRLWPENTYVDFDNAINSAVRKLRDALGDSPENPRFVETLARRGYRFIAPVSTAGISSQKTSVALEPAVPKTPARWQVKPASNRPWLRWALVLPVVAALSLLLFVLSRPEVPPSQYEVSPVTTEAGMQLCPSFAPDGQRVTFSWDGEKQDNFDIYAKQIGAESSLRLTTDPGPDLSPAWSPDGNTIAFIRIASSTRAQVLQISAFTGGQERVVAEIAAPSHLYREVRLLSWSPDGKWLAVSDGTPGTHSAIYLLSIESGTKRQLTQPGATYNDFDPAFSSDGSRLAFARQAGPGVGELYILKLTHELKPVGELQQITFDHRRTSSPVWAPNGRSLFCVRLIQPTRNSLCKIIVSNPPRVESLPVPADNVVALALAPRTGRLIYARQTSLLSH